MTVSESEKLVRGMTDEQLQGLTRNLMHGEAAEHEIEARRLRDEGLEKPFDPRREVSADAQYIAGRIIKHIWIVVVLLPIALAIVIALSKSAR